MASFSGDAEGNTEDIPAAVTWICLHLVPCEERKKSKLKSLKTRLFGRSKRGSSKKNPKLSQSESDITTGKGLGSEEDLVCSQGTMPSRALSHDSIFLDDQALEEAEPTRVSSQENVQSKIKVLQMKLQQQKMHLGPPPLVLPIKRPEDSENRSDDENLSVSPPDISTTSQPLSPIPKPSPTKYALQTPQPLPVSVTSNSSVDESPSDFSSPAQLTPRLDTSAARHRMSVKPRNQRAGSKKKISDAETDYSSTLDSVNNIDHDSDSDKEQQPCKKEEVTLESQHVETVSPNTAQVPPPKPPEVSTHISEVETKSVSLTSSQLDQTLPETAPPVTTQILRVKTHTLPNERPHSCFLPSELKDKKDTGFEIEAMCHDKRNTGTPAGPEVALRSTSVQQQALTESTTIIKRSTQGSGSFHLFVGTPKNRDGERPRSGSFAGVLEKTETRHRYEKKPILTMKEKEELRELQLRGANAARLRQEGTPQKSPGLQWDKRESLKKVETQTTSTSSTTDTAAVKWEEVKEEMEKQEVQEEEGKTTFGVKLRSTSLLGRSRSEAPSNQTQAPVGEEPCDKQKVQDMSNNTSNKPIKMSTDTHSTAVTPGDKRQADPTSSGLSSPLKKTPPPAQDPHIMTTMDILTISKLEPFSITFQEVEPIPEPPKEPPPPPQSASSEVSWMSLAMEKTKSIQQLFTRFPRDLTGAAPRPQAQSQPTCPAPTPAVVQTQTVKMQQSAAQPEATKQQQSTAPVEAAKQVPADAVKAETAQSTSQTQAVKPSVVAAQQRASISSPIISNTSREPLPSKQTSQPQPQPTTTHPAVKTNPMTTQPPVHSAAKTQNQPQTFQPPSYSAAKTQNQPQTFQPPSCSAAKTPAPSQTIQPPSYSAAKTPAPSQTIQPPPCSAAKPPITSQTIQPPSYSAAKTPAPSQTIQPPSYSAAKPQSTSLSAQGSATQSLAQSYLSSGHQQQQTPWGNRSTKSTTPAPTSVSTAPSVAPTPPDFALEGGEKEKETAPQEEENVPMSVSERAAFLEKRAERMSSPTTKGVELRKAQTEAQTSSETPASAKAASSIKDTKPEGRQLVKPAESSPTKIPDRPREDKWLRKNVSSPARSMSPTMPSSLQTMSDSGQPSWMELAKRKSMAWSDKSMD
ncbi:proteoglycan 4 [Cheilinus undulatus]|uniref:proteoglycan 4 n=1 Tax=Cheilinus undulatus TaxID=241271 RepID=UPI001BD44AB8|nr:proteoglycan 4 [Cheilinus undulatus]